MTDDGKRTRGAFAPIEALDGGIHRITHPLPFALDHVHSYAIEGDDGWTIVDGGHVWDAEQRWREILEELGHPAVERILVTHHHPDHLAGCYALSSLTGAEVVQGRIDWDVTQRVYGEGILADIHPNEPALLLDEDDLVSAGPYRFRVLHLPGHADGHIAFYDEEQGIAFGGDVILNKITPNVSWREGMYDDPLSLYESTLRRIQQLAPALVYPGHLGVVTDTVGRAEEILAHHDRRLDETESHLRGGASSAAEVVVLLWGDGLTPHEHRFARGEAIAHLQRLQALGRVVQEGDDEWRAVA